jgi:hypothetical protein
VPIPDSGAQSLTVRDLLARCSGTSRGDLALRAGASGLSRRITRVSLQKTGLALTGQPQYLEDGRVLLFGRSEVQYLAGLERAERLLRLREVLRPGLPCVVVTAGLPIDPGLAEVADARGVPVLSTDVLTSETLVALTGVLEEGLAPMTTLHGVLVDILGLGVLLLLSMLGLAVGISTADIGRGHGGDAKAFDIGAGIWAGLSLLIALFLSGIDRLTRLDGCRPDRGHYSWGADLGVHNAWHPLSGRTRYQPRDERGAGCCTERGFGSERRRRRPHRPDQRGPRSDPDETQRPRDRRRGGRCDRNVSGRGTGRPRRHPH